MMPELFNEIKPYSFRFEPVHLYGDDHKNRDVVIQVLKKIRERQIRKEIKKTMGSTRGAEIYWVFEYQYRNSIVNELLMFLELEVQRPKPNPLTIEDYKTQIGTCWGSSGFWCTAFIPYVKFKNEDTAVMFKLKYQGPE